MLAAPTVYELDGSSRSARLSDCIRFAKLIHQCNHFSINGGILAQPSNVPVDVSHLIMARYLNLPSRCGGSNTDALCVSPQSGYEGMLSMNQMLNEYQQPQFDTAIKSELDNYMMFQGVDKIQFTDIQDLIAS